MQSFTSIAFNAMDELSEVFTEMRGHLYLFAGTLLLKMAVEKEHQWKAVIDFAALCYLLAYQVRPDSMYHSSMIMLWGFIFVLFVTDQLIYSYRSIAQYASVIAMVIQHTLSGH